MLGHSHRGPKQEQLFSTSKKREHIEPGVMRVKTRSQTEQAAGTHFIFLFRLPGDLRGPPMSRQQPRRISELNSLGSYLVMANVSVNFLIG